MSGGSAVMADRKRAVLGCAGRISSFPSCFPLLQQVHKMDGREGYHCTC